ncbi:hypothetical protein F4803DRAFT_573772 [Xylaria telfairii]|nr:hypothetical protein F4803DRAFT_573772 [Xylaria telfairii]
MPTSSDKKRAEAAVRDVVLGTPVRAAAIKWDVERTYIQRRIAGIPTRKEANQQQQRLSPFMEQQLANWAIGQARLGFSPPLVRFRAMALHYLKASGSDITIGSTGTPNLSLVTPILRALGPP